MMWLIKFADNWADEMDVEGFSVMSTGDFTQWAQTVEAVANKIDAGHTFEWYIGTNEWFEWESGEEFKSAFSCEVITEAQAEVLQGMLLQGYWRYGFFPSADNMLDFLEDE